MPELARFWGIVISMFYRDHGPPHIHVSQGNRRRPEWTMRMGIRDGRVLDEDGYVPSVAIKMVKDWVSIHRDELMDAWDRAYDGDPPGKIAPLRIR